MNRIVKFWVVTKPTPHSVLADILFEADDRTLGLQIRGGLRTEDIHGTFSKEAEAEAAAQKLLDEREG
jgi:hypothetical protein